jgi:hypothetical protein
LSDSQSAVGVSIHDNPSNGQLSPNSNLFVIAKRGVVKFHAIRINKFGLNYTLKFDYYTYSRKTGQFSLTNISFISEKFNIYRGPPRTIALKERAAGAWAGNQPFYYQPSLELLDYSGENRLIQDFASIATVSMTQSLSVDRQIVIDTYSAAHTTIDRISLNQENITVGAGQVLVISLHFKYLLFSNLSVQDALHSSLPYLQLNIQQSNDESYQNAYLHGSQVFPSRSLRFEYTVQDGDVLVFDALLNTTSLFLQSNYIVDGNYRQFDSTIPVDSVNATINVNTLPPVVTEIKVNTTSTSVYGPGDVLDFIVSFNQPVMVSGTPFLLLAVNESYSGTIDKAVYHPSEDANDDRLQLHFRYFIEEDFPGSYRNGNLSLAFSEIICQNHTLNSTSATLRNFTVGSNTTLGYHYGYRAVSLSGGWIRRLSDFPTTPVNYTIIDDVLDLFYDKYPVKIDTSPPAIDLSYGLQSSNPSSDGAIHSYGSPTYYPGDKIFLTIRFTKPVVVFGVGIKLILSVGALSPDAPHPTGSAFYLRSSAAHDNSTVEFVYIVEPNTNTSAINMIPFSNAIRYTTNDSFIQRIASIPSQLADLNTSGLDLTASSILRLSSTAPKVMATSVVSTVPIGATALYPDDSILVEVTFSGPVMIAGNCPALPVLALAVSPYYYREAVYQSGNGTNIWIFEYTILIGDNATDGIHYRTIPSPNSLCPLPGCPRRVTSCRFYANATLPVLLADTRLSAVNTMLGNQTLYPSISAVRNTTIISVSVQEEGGEYGVGSVFHVDVTFSDIVAVVSSLGGAKPTLLLNLNKTASYYKGDHTKTLTFVYVAQANDTLTNDDLSFQLPLSSITSITCSGCEIVNQMKERVNLNMSSPSLLFASGVRIDPSPPSIITCHIRSADHSFNLTTGNILEVEVIIDKPVVVGGLSPKIDVFFDHNKQYSKRVYANYVETLSNGTSLVFHYQLTTNDHIYHNISIINNQIDLLTGFSQILRNSTIPTTPLNNSIPITVVTFKKKETLFPSSLVDIPSSISSVVSRNSSSANYTVGDALWFEVSFDHPVVAMGYSYLQLDVGYGQIANATYFSFYDQNQGDWMKPDYLNPSSRTTRLLYSYTVKENDFNPNLEYVDITSLIIGQNTIHAAGYIKTFPDPILGIDADLTLPFPGSSNSISGTGAVLAVDGRAPYLKSLSFLNPDGIYSINETIVIEMIFSSLVVVHGGIPSIILETGGPVKQEAIYVSGSGSDTLLFSYQPEPGDWSYSLDYFAQRKKFLSAEGSFRYNGASVLARSQSPSCHAQIWLNPPGGKLVGDNVLASDGGVFDFLNLGLSGRGPDYLLRYEVTPSDGSSLAKPLMIDQWIYSSFSSEYQLRPASALSTEKIGSSVDIQGDLAVIGASNFNYSVTTVQVVTVQVAEGTPTREVQLISTSIQPQASVQAFHTTADIGATVSGFFKIIISGVGSTRPIPASVDESTLINFIQFDLPTIGSVQVSREPYLYCACLNAFTWTVTFLDQNVGIFDAMVLSDSLLTGHGSSISDVEILQTPSRLEGTYTLSAYGYTTLPINYDADVAEITNAIEIGLGLSVHSVSISMPTITTRVQTWSVTFDAFHDSFEIPPMVPDPSGLSGGAFPFVYVQVSQKGVHGPKGIAGYFQLTFRENTTIPLLPNTTAIELKAALEALPSINYVNVNRTLITPELGAYQWLIELVDVNYHNARGYYREYYQVNADPLIAHNHLIATSPEITVQSKYAFGDSNLIDSPARHGTYGEGAGSVFIYQRTNESWNEVAILRGNDTDENDHFGTSVSIDDGLIIVGAVGASMNGVPEKQSIRCHADNGSFSLSFRGWHTEPISFNVTRDELIDAIITPTSVFSKLYSITHITIDDWGEGGLCQGNNTAVITFYRPVDGAVNIFGTDTGPDLELLTVYRNRLLLNSVSANAVLEITEVQAGTWKVHGNDSDPQQIGAAYIFRHVSPNCSSNPTLAHPGSLLNCYKSQWKQETQLFPLLSRPFSQYGEVVIMNRRVAVVGSPGGNLQSGFVYVYEYDSLSSSWPLLQILADPLLSSGSLFGKAIAKDGNSIVISSPGYSNSTGNVFVYTRPASGGVFVFTQYLTPSVFYPLDTGYYYGQSVGISGDVAVVGCPGYNDNSIFLGSQPSSFERTSSGAVFVFRRPTNGLFIFVEKVTPSNVRDYDRFGFQIKMNQQTVLVSSLPKYDGSYDSSKPVITVKTYAVYDHTKLGGYFTLSWRGNNQTSSLEGNYASFYQSRPIRYDVSATHLQNILEEDLHTDKLLVSRSNVDIYNGGYLWSITFMRFRGQVDNFLTDGSALTGTNSSVTATMIVSNPPKLRNLVHLFQYNSSSDSFDEQLYLSPYRYQPNDLCGSSLSLSKEYAIVGCPNRDQDIPGQNSGVAMIYDLSIMNLAFSTKSTTITEGDTAFVNVGRDSSYLASPSSTGVSDRDILFYEHTVDRNANLSVQQFFSDHYGLDFDATTDSLSTVLDQIGIVGKAVGRSQYYGSLDTRSSRWVDGRYDYRGVSDYVPVHQPKILLSEEHSDGITIQTTNDSLVELPAEAFSVAISLPGLWPVVLSKFYHSVHLTDFSTGMIKHQERYGKAIISQDFSLERELFGASSLVDETYGVMFFGAPNAKVSGIENRGRVLQYVRENRTWHTSSPPVVTYFPPTPSDDSLGGNFGASLAISVLSKISIALLAIAEPLKNRIHLYQAIGGDYSSRHFSYQLSIDISSDPSLFEDSFENNNINPLFGSCLAMSGHMLAVGAPGIETVYLYYHYYHSKQGEWTWTTSTASFSSSSSAYSVANNAGMIRSSGYDYDVVNGVVHRHQQGFGSSLALSGRTLVVGSPFSNYDNQGTYLRENFNTEGLFDISGVGKGKAYVFYSSPSVKEVCIHSSQLLSKGNFRLVYNRSDIESTSAYIPFNASATLFQTILNEMSNVEEVYVSSHTNYVGTDNQEYDYCWTITFYSDWISHTILSNYTEGVLSVEWKHQNCTNCTVFNFLSPSSSNISMITVRDLSSITPFQEIAGLNAVDGRNGDRFGSSVAIDRNHIVVGSPFSSSMTITSWDFEAGLLFGWHKSGDAFDYQPTFGDNPRYRPPNSGNANNRRNNFETKQFKSSSSNMRGNYYISTYEKRPGNPANYLLPDDLYPAGNIQGFLPKGVLSSDIFVIKGKKITFFIGGGCDLYTTFVELLIDGKSVAKQTGKCSEAMEEVYFDVSQVTNRAAQIRIVDNSSSTNWGYISVDSFSFDWNVEGATVKTQRLGFKQNNLAQVTGGLVESPLSGAAYVFSRHSSANSQLICDEYNERGCLLWNYEAKLLPSDKREGIQFGSQVAIDELMGVIAISAPFAPLMGNYKDTPTSYPFYLRNGSSIASGLEFPLSSKNSALFQSFPSYSTESSGGYGVWASMQSSHIHPSLPDSKDVGAVYVYTKYFPILGYTGEVGSINETWKITEKAKIQPMVDGLAGDFFGSSFSLDRNLLVIGSPGHHITTSTLSSTGAGYFYHLEFAAVKFSQLVYPVLEGYDKFVTLTVLRDLEVYAGEVVLEYATNDLTAKGIDTERYDFCLRLPVSQRASKGCGDYEQTAGHLVIPAGVTSGGFTVRIMDDLCFSRNMKYIQVMQSASFCCFLLLPFSLILR